MHAGTHRHTRTRKHARAHTHHSYKMSVFVTGGSDSNLCVWDFQTLQRRCINSDHTKGITSLSIDPDRQLLMSADGAGSVYMWRFDPEEDALTCLVSFVLRPKPGMNLGGASGPIPVTPVATGKGKGKLGAPGTPSTIDANAATTAAAGKGSPVQDRKDSATQSAGRRKSMKRKVSIGEDMDRLVSTKRAKPPHLPSAQICPHAIHHARRHGHINRHSVVVHNGVLNLVGTGFPHPRRRQNGYAAETGEFGQASSYPVILPLNRPASRPVHPRSTPYDLTTPQHKDRKVRAPIVVAGTDFGEIFVWECTEVFEKYRDIGELHRGYHHQYHRR